MKKWKLLIVIMLINLAGTFGEDVSNYDDYEDDDDDINYEDYKEDYSGNIDTTKKDPVTTTTTIPPSDNGQIEDRHSKQMESMLTTSHQPSDKKYEETSESFVAKKFGVLATTPKSNDDQEHIRTRKHYLFIFGLGSLLTISLLTIIILCAIDCKNPRTVDMLLEPPREMEMTNRPVMENMYLSMDSFNLGVNAKNSNGSNKNHKSKPIDHESRG
jgi:hypothetical protein